MIPRVADASLIIKFLARGQRRCADEGIWLRQFPRGEPVWGRCRFVFDPDARAYDWLVVYDDLPRRANGSSLHREPLACAPRNTLLITSEPSSIRMYNRAFLLQFGHVLSSQEPDMLRHPQQIHSQCGLRWFYGRGDAKLRTYDEMLANPPLQKTSMVSTVCSAKRHRHTLHRTRFDFTHRVKQLLPELEMFGRGIRTMDDKAEALDGFRYHMAIENHIAPHHWTEKLADPFLGCALPLYCGCPNAADYFPPESFIAIDTSNPEHAAATIRQAIQDDAYTKRLPAILEARRRVLDEYNLFALLSRLIEQRHVGGTPTASGSTIFSSAAMRRRSPISAVGDFVEKIKRTLVFR